MEKELQRVKELLDAKNKEAEQLATELSEVKETADKLEAGRNYDQINLQSSREEVSGLETQLAKLRKDCEVKDVELGKKEETIMQCEQDNRDLVMQKNAVQM